MTDASSELAPASSPAPSPELAPASSPAPSPELAAAPGVIRIAAVVVVDAAGRTLLVRKRGTSRFMQAGGKIDAGETPVAAAVRELAEELGLSVAASDLEHWGRFDALAANEADHVVDADAFFVTLTASAAASVIAAAEIEQIVWLLPEEAAAQGDLLELAPLTRDVLLPMLAAREA
jgi:8-oxo-dGTP diphosphatase